MKQMIRLCICVMMMFISITSSAQKNKGPEFEVTQNSEVCDTIWNVADKPVEYPGGNAEMYDFLFKNMTNGSNLQAVSVQKMVVKMLVSSDGTVVEKKVLRSIDQELTQDVLQAMDKFPKLIPAKKNGKDVCAYFLVLVGLTK